VILREASATGDIVSLLFVTQQVCNASLGQDVICQTSKQITAVSYRFSTRTFLEDDVFSDMWNVASLYSMVSRAGNCRASVFRVRNRLVDWRCYINLFKDNVSCKLPFFSERHFIFE
jgi:hypothetical protein